MKQNLQAALLTNENARFAGISVNTSALPDSERKAYLGSVEAEFGMPCVDPVADGSKAIAQNIAEKF